MINKTSHQVSDVRITSVGLYSKTKHISSCGSTNFDLKLRVVPGYIPNNYVIQRVRMATKNQQLGSVSPQGSTSANLVEQSNTVNVQQSKSVKTLSSNGAKPFASQRSVQQKTTAQSNVNKGSGKPNDHKRGGKRENRNGKDAVKSQSSKIEAGVQQYQDTREYTKLKNLTYLNKAQLDRANAWISTHEGTIEPSNMSVCIDCDAGAQFKLCDCYIVTPTSVTIPADQHAHMRGTTNHVENLGVIRNTLYEFMDWQAPNFDFETQNNQNLYGFGNRSISDDRIISGLYNYITSNMNISYKNSYGFNDRTLRIEHCRRLAHRFADINKLDLIGDTILVNRFKFTVQRACDQLENDALYRETVPGRSFWQAWSPQSQEAWDRFIISMLCVFIIFMLLVAAMSLLAHYLVSTLFANIVARTTLPVIQTYLLNHLQLGNMQLLWSAIGTKTTICVLGLAAVIKMIVDKLTLSRRSTHR